MVTVQSVAARHGLTEIIWHVDSQDWNGASTDAIVRSTARLTNGQVILTISPRTGLAVAP